MNPSRPTGCRPPNLITITRFVTSRSTDLCLCSEDTPNRAANMRHGEQSQRSTGSPPRRRCHRSDRRSLCQSGGSSSMIWARCACRRSTSRRATARLWRNLSRKRRRLVFANRPPRARLSAETQHGNQGFTQHRNSLDRAKPTNAAMLLIGTHPQRFQRTAEVKCIHCHGTEFRRPMPPCKFTAAISSNGGSRSRFRAREDQPLHRRSAKAISRRPATSLRPTPSVRRSSTRLPIVTFTAMVLSRCACSLIA